MRTVKWNACLSGLCGIAAALGVMTASARADVTTERGASILAFPKVLANAGTDSDTIIQITNISNSMVHARCFYVNAQLDANGQPLWQETDFNIWLTKQQPTHWQVSAGRFVNPNDDCFENNQIVPDQCDGAGIDPGAVPPVPTDFIGELKCIEVDGAGNPIGGNHLKGEATIKTGGDVVKYNAVGIEGTELAGATGNTLLLNQPAGGGDVVGQYNACPTTLIVNHFAEGVTNPVILANERGGTCDVGGSPCMTEDDCSSGPCVNGPAIASNGVIAPVSATLTDLTLVPCQEDFENQIPGQVKVQFAIYNEFEERFSASTTITCWANFSLFQVDAPNNPERSVFSFGTLGSVAAQTRIRSESIVGPGGEIINSGGLLGVAGVTHADANGLVARTALNIHIEGDRFTDTNGDVIDEIVLPEH